MKLIRNVMITALTLILAGCSGSYAPISKSAVYFDTIVSVEIYGANASQSSELLDECMNICDRYENLWDKKIKTSDIARINDSACPVTVDPDTVSLLTTALGYSEKTDGRFDVTIAPVSDLWDFHEGSSSVPDKASLEKACSHVGYNNLLIDKDKNIISKIDPETSVDVGSIAKGYVADRIAEYLSANSITGAIINMGGDMKLIGSKPDGGLFSIGIQDPFESNSCIEALTLSDKAVATSGTYERCFVVNGTKYHHILDTKTGYPVDTDIESVTVITGSAVDSDCLCTVALIDGSQKALDMLEKCENTEAVIILTDKTVLMTSGAGKFIRQ